MTELASVGNSTLHQFVAVGSRMPELQQAHLGFHQVDGNGPGASEQMIADDNAFTHRKMGLPPTDTEDHSVQVFEDRIPERDSTRGGYPGVGRQPRLGRSVHHRSCRVPLLPGLLIGS